jgi:DNA-binding NarL/FixJ family response regulator
VPDRPGSSVPPKPLLERLPTDRLPWLAVAGVTAPTNTPKRARLVLAEDDVLLREGLAALLDRHGFEVAGQAGDVAELWVLVRDLEPEVVVLDIRMPPTHTTEGLDAALELRRERPQIGVLVLSAHVEVESAMELISGHGGVGYMLKSRVLEVEEILDAVDRVASGRSVVDPDLVRELFERQRRSDPLAELTTREREVLALMAEGRSNAGIGRELWLAEGTVEKHVKSILAKLDITAGQDDHRRVLAVLAFLKQD